MRRPDDAPVRLRTGNWLSVRVRTHAYEDVDIHAYIDVYGACSCTYLICTGMRSNMETAVEMVLAV